MPNEIKVTGRKLAFSESVLRLNPQLFGAGALPAAEPKPNQGRALDAGPSPRQASRGRMASGGSPLLRITLVSCRRRLITDRGNAVSGWKELQDCIARFFDLDDEDGTIQWEYGQCETQGEQETLVRIELI